LAPPTLLECLKNGKIIHEIKRTRFSWNAIVCETSKVSGGDSIFPIFQKYVSVSVEDVLPQGGEQH